MTERESEQLSGTLAELRDDAELDAACVEVRARTMAVIRRRRFVSWGLAACAAAAVLVVVAGVGWRTAPQARVTPPVQQHAAVPVVAEKAPAPVRKQVRIRPARPVPPVKLARAEPMKFQFETDDPDVVIIWLVDEGEVI